MTKKIRYDDEELEILQALEAGSLKPVLLQSQSGFARTTLMSPAEDSWNSI